MTIAELAEQYEFEIMPRTPEIRGIDYDEDELHDAQYEPDDYSGEAW